MNEVIHLDSNTDYQQYVPYDIIAVNESFRKLYDRRNKVFQFESIYSLPLDILFHCKEGTTWEEVLNNDDWVEIRSSVRDMIFRSFIHESIKEEYLKRTDGVLKWKPQFIYEIVVNKHRVTLDSNNYKDFTPRKIMAIASLNGGGPISEIIDEYGEWFYLSHQIKYSELQFVFSNYNEFKFERDDTFFHMGLGTGMWVDRSIVEPFSIEAEHIYSGGKPPLPDGTKKRSPGNLHPVWREVVWNIINTL